MASILIIGGYGGFGARLARRLAERGHRVLVGGRNRDSAVRFAAGLPGAMPLQLDRNADLAPVLAEHRPALLIDAAGPFQASGYAVPRACVTAGIPYLDLADARGFVAGIGELDAEALRAGVAVIAGASSVPALSGAAARALAEGMDAVRRVDMAISASNRAGAGPSVTRAILSYVGRPLSLWRGGRWTTVHGWQELRRERFVVAGSVPLRRHVAVADVPDHDLMPAMLPGRPAVTFRAGTELGFQNRALAVLGWLVRHGLIRSLDPLAAFLSWAQRLTIRIGGTRSAMRVAVTGVADGVPIERRWTLLAEQGDGPEIPTLAAVLVAEAILAGRVPAGAQDASRLLALAAFEPLFARLAVRHACTGHALPPPLYQRVMGEAFDALPPLVRALHTPCGDDGAVGEGRVERGQGLAARLIGRMMRFPPAGAYDLHVGFRVEDGVERWTRDFGGHRFASSLSERNGLVEERFGPLRFGFALSGGADGLGMRLRRWTAFGVPMPLMLAPRIAAREWQEGDRFHFHVGIAMPLIGPVVDYRGALRGTGSIERRNA